MHPPWLQATDRLEYRYANFTDNQGRLRELLQLNIIRLFAVDHSMQDDLYINSSFRTAVASCYMRYRGGCLMQTIFAQFHWELVGTNGLRSL